MKEQNISATKKDFVGEPRDTANGVTEEVTEKIYRLGMKIESRNDLDKFIEELKKLYSLFPDERINGFSQELLDVIAKKEIESKNNFEKSREIISNIFNGEPKNVDPLTEIPEPLMRLFGSSNFFSGESFYGTEEELIEYLRNNKCDLSFGDVYIIEFMGTMAGRSDVIRKRYRNGKQSLVTAATDDHIGTYNHRRSCHQGKFVWEGKPGNLRTEYMAFKERGIVLENDIYDKADERYSSIMQMIEEKGETVRKRRKPLFCKKD